MKHSTCQESRSKFYADGEAGCFALMKDRGDDLCEDLILVCVTSLARAGLDQRLFSVGRPSNYNCSGLSSGK